MSYDLTHFDKWSGALQHK